MANAAQLQKRFQSGKLKGFVAPVKRKYKPTNRTDSRWIAEPTQFELILTRIFSDEEGGSDDDDDSVDEDEVDIAKRRKAGARRDQQAGRNEAISK